MINVTIRRYFSWPLKHFTFFVFFRSKALSGPAFHTGAVRESHHPCLFKFKLILFCLVFVFPLSFWCDFPVKDFAWYQVMLEFNVSKCTLCFRGVNFWWLLWCEALLSCVVVWFLAWCMVSRLFPWRKWVSGIETKISGLSRESGIGLHLLSLQILVSEAIFIWFVLYNSKFFNVT